MNISRGLTDVIKHSETFMDKVTDVGMAGAELADRVTWAAMWSACKEQVKRSGKYSANSEEFYNAVTDLFEEVIYKTQVVDSVLTKNEFLRSKGFFARAVGSFMSEPTTTASMLLDAYDKYQRDLQRGYSPRQAWEKNRGNIVRTAYVYAVGALLLAAATAVEDAWRDDDDYETFAAKFLDAFKSNAIDEFLPFNDLPILNDVYELIKSLLDSWGVSDKLGIDIYGNAPRSLLFQWRDVLVKGSTIFHDKITGDGTNVKYTWYGGAYKLLQAVSGMTGIPMAAVTREVVSAWNSTVGAMAPSLKVKSYDVGAKNSIKYAVMDGNLTEREAERELIARNVASDDAEAGKMAKTWASLSRFADAGFGDISEAAARDYAEYCQDTGVSRETFYNAWSATKSMVGDDKDGDGKSDAGTKANKQFAYINNLDGLTVSQKKAIARALTSVADSTIEKYGWR